MRALLLLTLLLSACAAAPDGPTTNRNTSQPNIVVFMIDDLGWQDVSEPFHSSPTPFNRRYRTPNIERLARRGLKFTQAYAAAPVCTPTRTSLMTGRSPAQTRITYWTLHKDRDQSANYPDVRAPRWNMNALQEDDVTLPRLLRQAGYRTIHAGKAHLGAKGTSGQDPTKLGFDVNIGGHAAGGPGSYYGTQNFSASHRRGSRVWDVPGLEAYHGQEIYLTEALALEARKAVRAAAADGGPFFLHFAPYAVHAPIMVNPRYADHYVGLDRRESAYATMIETYDVAIGSILGEIDELGLTEETIVVFTSDNGGLSAHARGGEPHTHNAPLRSGKGSSYEGGVRVPQIIAWPGVTDGAGTSDLPVITYDLFPTILDWAGAEIPADYASTVEGRDLVPLLTGRGSTEELTNRALFWHQPHYWGVRGPGIFPYSAIRFDRWKLIYRHGDRGFELYDLAADLGETRDLAAADPERVQGLAELLSLRLEAVHAQMSIDKETGRPIALPRDAAR
jgi:arylsulfatase A-like enzyme